MAWHISFCHSLNLAWRSQLTNKAVTVFLAAPAPSVVLELKDGDEEKYDGEAALWGDGTGISLTGDS
jgi:hypothetical protein